MDNATSATAPTSPNKAATITHVCFLASITLAITTGNVLVIVVVRLDRRLHSPTFYFLGNLAVADLLVGVGYVPFYMASVVQQAWLFGPAWCKGHAFVVSTSVNASLMTLCVVSLDRYLDITDPLRYYGRMTKKKTYLIIAFIWAHSVFWAGAPLVGWGEIIYDYTTKTCRPGFTTSGITNKLYGSMLALFGFALPVLGTVYSFLKIFRVAEDQSAKIAKVSSKINIPSGQAREGVGTERRPRKERKAHKMILIIIGAFVVCWLPYSIGTTWKLLTGHALDSYWFAHIGLTLALGNSAINPLVYTVRDRRFRRGFVKILCARYRRGQSFNGSATNSAHYGLSYAISSRSNIQLNTLAKRDRAKTM